MIDLDRLKRWASASKATTADAFDAGRDVGMHGATTSNSHFRFFASEEHTIAWMRGYDEGKADTGQRSEAPCQ